MLQTILAGRPCKHSCRQHGAATCDVTEKSDESQFSYDHLAATTIIHGSPDTVIGRIEEFRAAGATSLMVHYPPYYGPERTLDMLRLFAREVLPHIREDGKGAGVAAQ